MDNSKLAQLFTTLGESTKIVDKQLYDEEGYLYFQRALNKQQIKELNQSIDELVKDLKPNDDVFDESGTLLIKQIQYLHIKEKKRLVWRISHLLLPIAQALTGEEDFNMLNVRSLRSLFARSFHSL